MLFLKNSNKLVEIRAVVATYLRLSSGELPHSQRQREGCCITSALCKPRKEVREICTYSILPLQSLVKILNYDLHTIFIPQHILV